MPTELRNVLSSTWALGALVFALTWGGGAVAPTPLSLDISAYAGLNMAIDRGLDHGTEIIFTYGPLGFLKTNVVFYEWTARLSGLYGIGLHLALSLSLVWAARRNFPLVAAVAVALVAAVLLRGDVAAAAVRDDAAVVVLAFIWCAAALDPRSPRWVLRMVVFAGGPFAALELLAKPNTGVIVIALLALTVVAIEADRRRNLAILAAAFTGSLVVLWLAAGQGIGNVVDWIASTREIVSGYSSGARIEYGTRDYDYVLAPLLVAVTAAIAWVSTRELPSLRRTASLLMLALVAFTALKAGFVSHEVFHMATFFSTILGACIAFRLPQSPRVRFAALAAIAGVAAAGFTPSYDGYPLTDPVENVRNGASTLVTLADGGRLEDEIADSRAAMIDAYGLDAETLDLLRGRSVHVDPSEASVVWAHELDWHPLPVYQSYLPWTEELDVENAVALASPDGPEMILRQNVNPLGRYPGFESPAAMIAMLCNFRPLHTTEGWQVLERGEDRCGEPRPLSTVEAAYGDPIPVPLAPDGSVVFARVDGVQVSRLERARAFLLRARGRLISFDGYQYVFIPATAGDGLLLRAAPGVDFPAPFALAPNDDEFTFLLDGGPADEPITVEYFSMPVKPLAAEPGGKR